MKNGNENLKQNKIEILEMKKTKMKNEKYIMKNEKIKLRNEK